MQNKHLSHNEIHRLLARYIICLNKYFSALHEACQLKKQTTLLYTRPVEDSSIEVLERFIRIGEKLQQTLLHLQDQEEL